MALNRNLNDSDVLENVDAIRQQGGSEYHVRSYLNAIDRSNLYERKLSLSEINAEADRRSAADAGALFPAKTGEGPLAAGAKATGNVPSSIFNLGKSAVQAIANPIDTAKGVFNVGAGAVRSLREATGAVEDDQDTEAEQTFDAVAQIMKDRYGSLENMQRTFTNDPFGAGADLFGIFAGGAGVAAKVPGVAKAANTATKPVVQARNAARAGTAGAVERSAQKSLTTALSPTKEANKAATQAIVPELVKRKPVALTDDRLNKSFQARAKVAGEAIDEAWKALPEDKRLDITPVVNALEESKQRVVVDGVVANDNAFKAADDLQRLVLEVSKGDDLAPIQSIRRLRQIWDEQIDSSNGFTRDLSEQQKLKIQRDATDAIRRAISEDSPDIAVLNREYMLWRNASDIMEATIKRRTGQEGGFKTSVQAAGGGVVGGAGGSLKLAALGAATVGIIALAMRTTAWRTASAAMKSKLADAIYAGKATDIKRILAPILVDQGLDIIQEAEE